MEQLTLEQELNRTPEIPDYYIEGEPDAYINGYKTGFKEGSEWQKEQYKNIKKAMQIVISCLQNAPDRNYEIETLMNACHNMPD